MKAAILCCLLGVSTADLRQASQPKKAFNLLQQNGGRGSERFTAGTTVLANGLVSTNTKAKVLYMEPSTFGYNGLKQQRQNNYDNFLRSNIDNEQDNRNFNNEVGLDHLPFRTFENAVNTQYPHTGTRAGTDDDSLQVNNVDVDTVLSVKPGERRATPLRWNNPHASELEVNLWIMCADPPSIVPIKKPACSGEGNQNNVIEWAIPSDFNEIDWTACPSTAKCAGGFTGCKTKGECVLQIYSHSVETRQYSTSVPIIIEGTKVVGGTKALPYSPVPLDNQESSNYAWPTSYDLRSLTQGRDAQPPAPKAGENAATLNDVAICASSEKEAVTPAGNPVYQVQLTEAGVAQLSAPTVHLYLCKQNAQQVNAEQLVDQVVFTVQGTTTQTKTENYTPFEFSSTDNFGSAELKTVTAVLTPYAGSPRTITAQLDLSVNKRWRFRRHLKSACPSGVLAEPCADPWMDLSKLNRETCLSAQDPNANYAETRLQRAVLNSDVANHAYQNSNYSPYSGQQHCHISRNLQAAAVIHMTSANRGELGQNNIPNEVKQVAAQLNNQVNKLYKAYEKVANKIIDAVTQANGKNGGNTQMGVQPLASSFRADEKGATSTKRLKTTTYVPSFNTAGYDMAVIQKTLNANAGRNGVYADLLSDPKPNTGAQYIEIYQATMNKMLPAFAQAEKKGVTYMESVKMLSCTTVQEKAGSALALKSQDYKTAANSWTSTPCCTGSMLNKAVGGCGATLPDLTEFRKRNQAGQQDGGRYAAKNFNEQRNFALYSCPQECQYVRTGSKANLATATTKGSRGTCIDFLDGSSGCVKTGQQSNTALDCRNCASIFSNVAPKTSGFSNPLPPGNLDSLVKSLRAVGDIEELGNVINTPGDGLVVDNTAICHTPSKFTCPGTEDQYDDMVAAGQCTEVESTKIDDQCDDGPCDSDSESPACLLAKARCLVDPDTGVMCMPGQDNDPCLDCVDGGVTTQVSAAFALLAVLLSFVQ